MISASEKTLAVPPERQQILDVDEADHVVERVAVDEQAGVAGVAHGRHDLVEPGADLDRANICSRDHDVVDPQLPEAQGIEQELTLVGRELLGATPGILLLEQVLERLAQAAGIALAGGELAQSAQQALEHRGAGVGLAGQLPHRTASEAGT
jgi:hypothetical protein